MKNSLIFLVHTACPKKPLRIFRKDWMIFSKISFIFTSFKKKKLHFKSYSKTVTGLCIFEKLIFGLKLGLEFGLFVYKVYIFKARNSKLMSDKLVKQVKEYQQQQKINVLEFGALSVNCSFAKIAGPVTFFCCMT